MRVDSGDRARLRDPFSPSASEYETGKPFDASATAGAMFSAHFFLPYLFTAISKPRTVPGTPDERQPSTLSLVISPPPSRYLLPEAFSAPPPRHTLKLVPPPAMR